MATWKRKAIELFPDLKEEIEESIYLLFSELINKVIEAHKNEDIEELKKIYDFAEWCTNQKSKDIWNSAGVSFYEHLIDNKITYEAIPIWIKPKVFENHKGLWQYFLQLRKQNKKYNELIRKYNKINKTNFQEIKR